MWNRPRCNNHFIAVPLNRAIKGFSDPSNFITDDGENLVSKFVLVWISLIPILIGSGQAWPVLTRPQIYAAPVRLIITNLPFARKANYLKVPSPLNFKNWNPIFQVDEAALVKRHQQGWLMEIAKSLDHCILRLRYGSRKKKFLMAQL